MFLNDSFPHIRQLETNDCGPTCLKIIAQFYNRTIPLKRIKQLTNNKRTGTTLLGLSNGAEDLGFHTIGVKIGFDTFVDEVRFPCIVHWGDNHFVVVYKISRKYIYVSDPAHGKLKYRYEDFFQKWSQEGTSLGVALLLSPSPKFYKDEDEIDNTSRFLEILHYLKNYKKLIIQVFIGLFTGSILQLVFPLLTQGIVDVGIRGKDVNFVYVLLTAQLFFYLGRMSLELLRGWILLHISSRVNIALVSDFFIKLMKLPIAYFDSKAAGDLMQRISDHYRIESFITGSSINTIFSFFNLLIFSFVLAWYSAKIFVIFLIGSVLYFLWVVFFMKRRAELDYKTFSQRSINQSKQLEIIFGMQEIKLHNAEKIKRWQWEEIQSKLFKIRFQTLKLSQFQNSGSSIINEIKNICVTGTAALLVIDNSITLGSLLSISYILGQLNSPVSEIVSFMQQYQDAKLSYDRLGEIHAMNDESTTEFVENIQFSSNAEITISNCYFKYDKLDQIWILKDVCVNIPLGKVTAIVGESGSGKSTLLKLLLKYYNVSSGTISIDNLNLNSIKHSVWRNYTGVVMQEGYIFSDSIAGNIAIGEQDIDYQQLRNACSIANILDFIESLPRQFQTPIGADGIGLSGGQKQRILIARAVYRKPEILFLDEATSSLDAENERVISQNLDEFFKERTAIVIAHRLSTVKNADQILVLDNGSVVEIGTHNQLIEQRGKYFNLVKNQLESKIA